MCTDTFEENRYCLVEFVLESNTLRSKVVWWSNDEIPPNISSVVILGVNNAISDVAMNAVPVPFKYDTVNKVITVF